MEGLNKLCLSIYLRPWISKHAWANSIAASRSRSKLKTLNPKPMGDQSHKNNGTRRLSHFWPLIFTPYISQKPLFLPKIVSQSPLFFPHCPKFVKLFTQRPQIGWNLRKRYPNAPIFMAFVTERLPIFCLACTCLRRMLLPQTRCAETGKFCILETELCNLVNTFWCKLVQGDENNISVLQAQLPQLYIMDKLHWKAGLIHRPSSLWSNTEGDISYNHPLYDCAQLGSLKCQVFLRLCKRRYFKCKVQCRARWRARENFEI